MLENTLSAHTAVVAIMAIFFLPSALASCQKPVETFVVDDPYWSRPIDSPGEHCLTHNLRVARGGFVWSEGHERASSGDASAITVSSSNVSIDLEGHDVLADLKNLSAVRLDCDPQSSIGAHGFKGCANVAIRNGKAQSRTQFGIVSSQLFKSGVEFGSILSDFDFKGDDVRRFAFGEIFYKSTLTALGRLKPNFPRTGDIIENVRVAAGFPNLTEVNFPVSIVGVGIQGAANVIRGNTIIIDGGQAALYLYGPNQLIENNIIIFRGDAAAPSAAPIKLHYANASVIRKNTIIVEGRTSNAPQAAISLIDSKDVVIENNRVFGVAKTWKDWDGNSTAREFDTRYLDVKPSVQENVAGVQ